MREPSELQVGDLIDCEVIRICRRRDDGTLLGLEARTETGRRCFLPRRLLADSLREGVGELLWRWVQGVIRLVDPEREYLVVEAVKQKEPQSSTDKLSNYDPAYLELLLDNLDNSVPKSDKSRYLGRQNAKNILVALCEIDLGFEVSAWRNHLFGHVDESD